jgi:hypothetical protein
MKHSKNLISISIALFCSFLFISTAHAQGEEVRNTQEGKDKIKAQKVAFITDRLDLSSKEAKEFWPVYEEHEALVEQEKENFKKSYGQEIKNIENLKKEDAEKLLSNLLAHEQKLLDLRKQFTTNLSNVISPNKILMLFEAEKEFRKELMKRLSQRKAPQNRQQGRRPEGR